MERDREEITEHAMQHGVIEKKDNKKLDWMYKGPNSTVNTDEYLMGKRIDKAFEDSLQASKDAEANRVPKNHVEHGTTDVFFKKKLSLNNCFLLPCIIDF